MTSTHIDMSLPRLRWRRGRANRDGLFITIAAASARSYTVPADPQIAFALAKVRTPGEACLFAESWGLLQHGKQGDVLRELFTGWQQTAASFDAVLQTW